MEEYQQIFSLYQSHKKYERNMILLAIGLLLLASFFVGMDVFRIKPIMIYLLMMVIVLFFVIKLKVTSKNFEYLQSFLKKNKKEVLKNKELVFYLDYQLTQSYKDNPKELGKLLKAKEVDKELLEKINHLELIFDAVSVQMDF